MATDCNGVAPGLVGTEGEVSSKQHLAESAGVMVGDVSLHGYMDELTDGRIGR